MTRSLKRRFAFGQELSSWPMLSLLVVVVLVLTACVLWFMNKAMENERFAVRQRLTEAYRSHLLLVQERLNEHWTELGQNLERVASSKTLAAAFEECLRIADADGVICFDLQNSSQYPDLPREALEEGAPSDEAWRRAERLESEPDSLAAASAYGEIARRASESGQVARALQAQARCLIQHGDRPMALQVLTEAFAKNRFGRAADGRGRLILASAELMALDLMPTEAKAQARELAARLRARLTNYHDFAMPSAQRRFLMNELQERFPGEMQFPTLKAELFAARLLETQPGWPAGLNPGAVQTGASSNIWIFLSPNARVAALYEEKRFLSELKQLSRIGTLPDVSLRLLAPDERDDNVFLSGPAGPWLPGWRVAMDLKDGAFFDTMANQRIASYLWTGVLAVAAMSILALVIGHAFRRQLAVTRLKNDLVATVSHELKTPLASMRLLVDTLLDSQRLQEKTVREYLQLIAAENARLSRLIDNFLTFSRMERNKYAFKFELAMPETIVQKAAQAVRERFDGPSCRFLVMTEPALRPVTADEEALVTALINLLDNAFKYSGDQKEIVLRARSENSSVIFEVQDNGIGLSPRDAKKVFRRFYQVDQHLSRGAGGCGLGLSIVQFIVTAHEGCVRVESRLGAGSTFRLVIPAAPMGSEQGV